MRPTPSKEDATVAPGPSLEFLKWLGDSLKGLNNSVNRACPLDGFAIQTNVVRRIF